MNFNINTSYKIILLSLSFFICITNSIQSFANFAQIFNVKQSITMSEQLVLNKLTHDLESLLPQIMQKSILSLDVSFRLWNEPQLSLQQVARVAYSSKDKVTLLLHHEHLKKLSILPEFGQKTDIQEGFNLNQKISSKHRSYYQYILGTLIHELGHIYDQSSTPNKELLIEQNQCRQEGLITHGARFLPQDDILSPSATFKYQSLHCQRLMNMNFQISSHPFFLDAAGYSERGLLSEVNSRELSNHLVHRSPDPYEWSEPKETFAVNLEFFILDPYFKCKRPTLYQVFRSFLQRTPYTDIECTEYSSLFVSPSVHSPPFIMNLDFSRVFSVHYFLAGEGTQPMSRFGHGMLRLVICSPQRKTVNEDCLMDLNYHIVISMRASLTEAQVDILKGLNGGYSSVAYALPLVSVIKDYTFDELRWIKSLPLKLSRIEIKNLLSAIIETQWNYEGKFKFLLANCADETLQLLKRGLPFNRSLQEITISRPDTLFTELVEHQLGDNSVLKIENQATRLGYYFPSKLESFQYAFEKLRSNGDLQIKAKQLKEFFNLSAHERTKFIERCHKLKCNKSYFSSFLILENYILHKAEVFRMQITLDTVQKGNSSSLNEAEIAQSKAIASKVTKQLQLFFQSPARLLTNNNSQFPFSYGVPHRLEIEETALKYRKKDVGSINNQRNTELALQSFSTISNKIIGSDFENEIDQIQINIQFLKKNLRQKLETTLQKFIL